MTVPSQLPARNCGCMESFGVPYDPYDDQEAEDE